MLYQYGKDESDNDNLNRLISSEQLILNHIADPLHTVLLKVPANEIVLLDAFYCQVQTGIVPGFRNMNVYWFSASGGPPVQIRANYAQPASLVRTYYFIRDVDSYAIANFNSIQTRLPLLPIYGEGEIIAFIDGYFAGDTIVEPMAFYHRLLLNQ